MKPWLLVCLGALGLASAAWAFADQAVTEEVSMGRALYRGEVRFAQAPRVQGVSMPDTACVQCHGYRGEERSEAGVSVPPIRWQPLTQPRGDLAAYVDATQVAIAIERGQGRQGRPLQAPMPQFRMTAQERQALLAYLRVMGTDAEPVPGVSPQRVVVASVLPLQGAQAAAGEHIRAALSARFAAVNAAGGVFGRQIELRVVDGGETPASALAAARALFEAGAPDVFALVGSLLPDPDQALLQHLKRHNVPMVATLGVAQTEPSVRQLTYLLPSLQAQVQQLAAEMTRHCTPTQGPAWLLHPPRAVQLGRLLQSQPAWRSQPVADTSHWNPPRQGEPGEQVIALLAREQVAQLRERWVDSARPACLGTLAVISGTSDVATVTDMAEVVGLPMPPVVQDRAQPAGAALWPLLGDAAASVFAEALARSGRTLDSDRFVQALDTLHRFQPAPGLSVTFGPQRRHGFDVSHFWRENAHETPRSTP